MNFLTETENMNLSPDYWFKLTSYLSLESGEFPFRIRNPLLQLNTKVTKCKSSKVLEKNIQQVRVWRQDILCNGILVLTFCKINYPIFYNPVALSTTTGTKTILLLFFKWSCPTHEIIYVKTHL